MSNHRALYFAAVLLLALTVSCNKREVGHNFAPLVERILSDTTRAEFRPLSSFDPKSTDGVISLFGTPYEVARMTEYLLSADNFNNVDGSFKADSLPDFAGEMFSPVLDLANSPYQDYIDVDSEMLLEDIVARAFLSALDTAVFRSPSDTLPTYPRKKAKIVVFTSSLFSALGAADVDTLNAVSGRKIPVIFAPAAMAEYLYIRHSKGMNVGVLTTPAVLGAGVYSSVFPKVLKEHADQKSTYSVFCPDTVRSEAGKLRSFLSMYGTSGVGGPLTAIIVDDASVDMDAMREAVDALVSSDAPQDVALKSHLAKDFELVSPDKAVAAVCYRLMRNRNIFTHKIAYPDAECFVTVPSYSVSPAVLDAMGAFAHGYKYDRIPDEGVSAFSVVPMKDDYFSRAFLEYLENYTPNLFSLYVR